MDFLLLFTTVLSKITSWGLRIVLIGLVIGTIVDILKRKFHWSKIALILLVITLILLFIQIKLTYQLTTSF